MLREEQEKPSGFNLSVEELEKSRHYSPQHAKKAVI
jgi:hypothetical protein